MDELFTIIGKLYFDLYRSQNIINSLKEQLDAANTTKDIPQNKVK